VISAPVQYWIARSPLRVRMLGPKSICSISWIGGVIIGLKAAPSLRDGFDQLPKSRATTQVFSIQWIERCMNSWQGCISSNERSEERRVGKECRSRGAADH